MTSPSASSLVEAREEVGRIRELSRSGRHAEALASAEVLALAAPGDRDALYLIAANQRCLNRIKEALASLQVLEQHHPKFGLLYQERGYCLTTLRDAPRAIEPFLQAVKLNPALAASWTMLERLYRTTRETKAAAPAAQAAQLDYVRVLLGEQRILQARQVIDDMLRIEPSQPDVVLMSAAASVALGRHEQAIELFRQLLDASPNSAELHVLLGHSLQSVGRKSEAIDHYGAAANIRPTFGDAYWSLANLKRYHFSAQQISQMRLAESAPETDPIDRYHLCFALGKACEDLREYAESWQFYDRGNTLKCAESRYRPERAEANTRRQIEFCSAEFFSARACVGAPARDPIFIVGLPRSGSTLIEQILASHSQVDGTRELPGIPRLARELDVRELNAREINARDLNSRYPSALAELVPEDFMRLGERYIEDTRPYRGSKPFFTDKMPNNFRHIGLIHLILPNAKIIDVRREPMACCFSNFKQLFASGQEFTYSIEDLASHYRSYLELMWHWDAVLPRRVLRVMYEDVVNDLAGSVRRILEFCGLEFEPACVDFYKLNRGIHTASSEQVRQPIFREGLSQWRNFEPWLGSLKAALGDALIRYRESQIHFA